MLGHNIEGNDSPTDSAETPHQPTESEVVRFNAEPCFVHHIYKGADAEDTTEEVDYFLHYFFLFFLFFFLRDWKYCCQAKIQITRSATMDNILISDVLVCKLTKF